VSVLNDIEAGLHLRLTTTGGTAIWGSKVYAVQAPQGTALPYVLVHYISGGDTNESPSRIVDAQYQVEAWSESQVQAKQMAAYIEAALRDQALTVSGWNHIATTQQGMIATVQNEGQKQYWRRGADYRIRVSK